MLKIKQFVFSMFGVNTYVLIDPDTKEAAIIDPAMSDPYEQNRLDKYLEEEGAKLTQIINTHLHLDHCFGLNYVKNKYSIPAKAHIDDSPLGAKMADQYRKFGMTGATNVVVDVPLKDGDEISIGNATLSVIHVPGHTPGGIALYYKEGNVLFSGDSLFHRSIGRTDLEGGNHAQLINSIRTKLFTLPDQTLVLPGHSESTTIGEEKRANPFVR